MDIATLIGIAAGLGVVMIAIFIGGSAGVFINIPSMLIVVGGTIAATLVRFPLAGVLSAIKIGVSMAFGSRDRDPVAMIAEVVELARTARSKGLLGLDNPETDDEFLKKGVQMCADGIETEFIKEVLGKDRDMLIERLEEGEKIFRAIGDAAPAFGMIGTLIGLVQMLSTMSDPDAIGPAMAVALLTTLYGALISNLIALPIADKLASKMQTEYLNKTLITEGVVQISKRQNPDVLEDYLSVFLPEHQRPTAEAV